MTMTRISIMSASLLLFLSASAQAGLFLFAEIDRNPNIITHPTGYTGGNGQHLEISVCIDPGSERGSDLEIPVQNAIQVWNRLNPMVGNVVRPNNDLEFTAYDVESVLLHEIGHCIGLAHPNLASESASKSDPPLTIDEQSYAKTLRGGNNEFDLNPGIDDVIGSREDLRGDDVNLNWFQRGVNNPFSMPSKIDSTTYTTDVSQLPQGHTWVEIAAFDVWTLRSVSPTVAVMFQGIFNRETRRELSHDDAAMVRLGMAGTDRIQDTDKDYTFELQYGGIRTGCNINVSMGGNGFGFCAVGASSGGGLPNNHFRITSANITVGSTSNFNWHFNTVLREDPEPEPEPEPDPNVIFFDRFQKL